MKAWALRDKSTGLFIPLKKNMQTSAEANSIDRPRLHNSKRSAINTRTFWKKGWHTPYSVDTNWQKTRIEKRKNTEIEIVEFNLIEERP